MNNAEMEKSLPKPSKTFATFDLMLATFLIAKDKKLEGSTWQSGKLAFRFADDGESKNLIEDFINGTATVEVKKFITAHRDLKTLLYFKKEARKNE